MNVSYGLRAPQSYLDALPEVVAQVVNGCGPGGWKFDVIADNLLGLPIGEECDVHDWEYTVGLTLADKEAADERFLLNMLWKIRHAEGWKAKCLVLPRMWLALKYYEAVALAGRSAFWDGKIQPADI